jgi:hypothetical protein
MPLFPVPTYSSWQLACIAAVEPFDPAHPEHVQCDEDIRAELRTRQIPDSDVEEMIAVARRIGKRISPVVCMDVDDLELGIATQFDAGEIDAAERDRLLSFVAARMDLPREQRPPSSAKRRKDWTGTLVAAYMAVGFTLVALAQSRLGFFIWLAGVFVVIWIQQSWPSWRHRLRRLRAG